MKRDGHTVVLATHHIEEADQLCDRIAIIDQGRIVATGAPQELIARSNLSQGVSFEASQPVQLAWLAGLSGVSDLAVDGSKVRFRTRNINRALPELVRILQAHRLDLVDLRVDKITLEDVFIELTGSRLRE
jgi:ABC-2 type transport system ATP-binding protein